MSNERLIAETGNRQFYFTITHQKPGELVISMYSTSYHLIQRDDRWENHSSNYFTMAPNLIEAVISAASV